MIWQLPELKDKHIIFTGNGRDAVATREFLEKHGIGTSYDHISIDLNSKVPVSEQLGSPGAEKAIVIKAPGVPGNRMDLPYRTSTQIFFELAQQIGATIVGATGTKGKTTTTSLITHILQTASRDARVCGNIGNSFLPVLEDATDKTIFVAELSSYMLEDLRKSPHIAVITNLYNDHTDYHGSLEDYYAAKSHIVRHQTANDFVVFDPSFAQIIDWLKSSPAQQRPIDPFQKLDLSQTKLIGDHNRLNILLAVKACELLGVNTESALQAVKSFEPIEHRLEVVVSKNNVTFVNDAIASQPEAAIAGIKAVTEKFGPVSVLMLGGQDREYDFSELLQLIADQEIPNLVLFPDTIEKIKAALPASYLPNILETHDMAKAVTWASEQAQPNTVVLLSTAAPSYSIWKDFEEKGTLFKQAVNAL